jgi:hypothetical protein
MRDAYQAGHWSRRRTGLAIRWHEAGPNIGEHGLEFGIPPAPQGEQPGSRFRRLASFTAHIVQFGQAPERWAQLVGVHL